MANVKLYDIKADKEISDAAISVNGPVDAIFEAIQRSIGRRFLLTKFDISAVGEGTDALGKAEIQIKVDTEAGPIKDERLAKAAFSQSSADVDIITATAKAYVGAINKQLIWEHELSAGTARSTTEERHIDL
ncbi:Putative 2-isopropylmalate synthase [Rhizopus microsporus]|nr:Putative 2-isopropylmalate synthase [Rhizopus microsporus]